MVVDSFLEEKQNLVIKSFGFHETVGAFRSESLFSIFAATIKNETME